MTTIIYLFIYFVAENRQKRRHLIHLFVAKQVILVLINLLITFFFKIIKLFIGFKVLFKIFMILSKKNFQIWSQFNVKFNFNYVFMELGKNYRMTKPLTHCVIDPKKNLKKIIILATQYPNYTWRKECWATNWSTHDNLFATFVILNNF
jgi:hypothetical protein